MVVFTIHIHIYTFSAFWSCVPLAHSNQQPVGKVFVLQVLRIFHREFPVVVCLNSLSQIEKEIVPVFRLSLTTIELPSGTIYQPPQQ